MTKRLLLAVLMTAVIGARLFGPRIGMLAGMLFSATVLLGIEARLAKTDAMLLVAILVAIYGILRAYELRDVDIGGPHRTVQALVEEEVGVGRQRLPLGEGAGRLAIGRGLVLAVQVLARVSRAGFAVTPEQGFEFREQVRFRTEMTEAVVAAGPFLGHALLHLGAVVAMEAVAFDEGGVHPFATEDLIEGPHH